MTNSTVNQEKYSYQSSMHDLLRMEKLKAETVIAGIRLIFFTSILLINLVGHLLQRSGPRLESYLLAAAVLFSIFALAELKVIKKKIPFTGYSQETIIKLGFAYHAIVIFFDCLILSMIVYSAYNSIENPYFSVMFPFAPPVIYSGLFIIFTVLYQILDIFRFSIASTYYSAALFTALYLVLARITGIDMMQTAFLRSMQIYLISLLLSTILCSLISGEIYRIIRLTKQQQQLERYLPQAQAIHYMLESPDALLPGGRRQTITILFADIRGFTGISEDLSPMKTIEFLNEYFGKMVQPIFDNHGILDKYLGDGIMALFGAPTQQEGDADNAVNAAIQMQQELKLLNVMRARRAEPEIMACIGIHTGEVVLGNIGTEKRMDFTAIGDAVNTAARIEQKNRQLHTGILLSEETRHALTGTYCLTDQGRHQLRGRNQEIQLFSVDTKAQTVRSTDA
ncbi:adenylate/guanylate cyclase domain-containing protein [Spirochaeta dissipatitropha]